MRILCLFRMMEKKNGILFRLICNNHKICLLAIGDSGDCGDNEITTMSFSSSSIHIERFQIRFVVIDNFESFIYRLSVGFQFYSSKTQNPEKNQQKIALNRHMSMIWNVTNALFTLYGQYSPMNACLCDKTYFK